MAADYGWAWRMPRVARNAEPDPPAKQERLRAEQSSFGVSAGGYETRAGTRVSMDRAMQLSAVWACIRQTAQTIATLPVGLYRRKSDGSRERVDHRIGEVLCASPNGRQTAMEFWEGQIGWLLANGNAYAEIHRTGTQLSALEPISAMACEPVQATDGTVSYVVMDRGKQETLPADKVFHIRGWGMGGLKGLSAIRYGAQSMGAGLAADETAQNFFGNGLNPSGFFVMDQTLSASQRDQLQEALQAYAGSARAGKQMILEAGMKFERAVLNPEDAQMIETRKFGVEDICRWYGVPPIVIGHSADGQTMWGSGVEQILIAWMSQGLNPLMRRIEARARRDLIQPALRGAYMEWNREGMLQMESKAKAEFLTRLINGAVMTPNEGREKLNLPALPGGDRLIVQGAMRPLDDVREGDQR